MADGKYTAEQSFQSIANQYVSVYGAMLLGEMAAMEQQSVRYVMPRADARVRQISAKKRNRAWQIVAAVAACILIVLTVPAILRQQYQNPFNERAGTEQEKEQAAIENDGLMALTFVLPSNFRVADTELDNGKSIYYLEDTMRDDVVLTMESWDGDRDVFTGYDQLFVNDTQVYIESKADYQLLLFEKDGVFYTLTCRYDANTLLALSRHIL